LLKKKNLINYAEHPKIYRELDLLYESYYYFTKSHFLSYTKKSPDFSNAVSSFDFYY